MEVVKLFDIPKEVINDNERQRRVYSTDGISPTVLSRSDNAKIMEVKAIRVGGLYDGETKHQAGSVWDKNCIAPTIDTAQGGMREPMIIDEVKQLGFMDNGTGKHQRNTVVDEKGVSPTITTINGGGTQQIKVMTETVKIKQATKDGYIECEVGGVADLSFPDSKTRRGRVQDNGQVSPTLMAGEQDICRIEKVGQISNDGSQYGTVISDNGLCSTLSAGTHGYANNCIQTQYRIRKLTPLSCWRLMDFSDEDFEKAAQVNSNTQLYKQAGNSIVRNVLVAIIGQMIPGKEDVYKKQPE